MFFRIPVSQSKLVECAIAHRLVQRRLSTWLAPYQERCLFSTSINSGGSPEWQGWKDFFEGLLRGMVITEVAVD